MYVYTVTPKLNLKFLVVTVGVFLCQCWKSWRLLRLFWVQLEYISTKVDFEVEYVESFYYEALAVGCWKRKSWRLFCLFWVQLEYISRKVDFQAEYVELFYFEPLAVGCWKRKSWRLFCLFFSEAPVVSLLPRDTSLLSPTINQRRKVNNYQTTNLMDELQTRVPENIAPKISQKRCPKNVPKKR